MHRGGLASTLQHRRTQNEPLRTARVDRRAGFELSAGEVPPPVDDLFLYQASPGYSSRSLEDRETSPIEAKPSFGRSSKRPTGSGGCLNLETGSQRGEGIEQHSGQGIQRVKTRDSARGPMASLKSIFSKAVAKLCFRHDGDKTGT